MEAGTAGGMLRGWRQRRRLSQLALSLEAGISQKHLSFVESGRATPSRAMLLHLAEQLSIPLRERNALLTAAGYAPAYRERPLQDAALTAAREAVSKILTGHEPHPALAVDRRWRLVEANRAVAPLLAGAAPALLEPPVNVLRLSLHPDGLGPRIVNFREWRTHVIARLAREVDNSADPDLGALLEELRGYPVPTGAAPYSMPGASGLPGIAVPLILQSDAGAMSFISTTTVFGTALDISLAELTIESFFPADVETARVMRSLLEDDGA